MKLDYFKIILASNVLFLSQCVSFKEEFKVLNYNIPRPVRSIGLINVGCVDSNYVSQGLLEEIRMEIQHAVVSKNFNSAEVKIVNPVDTELDIASLKCRKNPMTFHGFKPDLILVFKELKFKKGTKREYGPSFMALPAGGGVMFTSAPYESHLKMYCCMDFYFLDNSSGEIIYYGKSSGCSEIISIDGTINQRDHASSFLDAFLKIMANCPF